MTSLNLTVGIYTVGGLDQVPSVVDAANQYNAVSTYQNLVAYQAALANAAAAFTATIQGAGAAFAGNALSANINTVLTNGAGMTNTQKLSVFTSMIGDMLTLVGQGATIAGLDDATINPIVGGGTFTSLLGNCWMGQVFLRVPWVRGLMRERLQTSFHSSCRVRE